MIEGVLFTPLRQIEDERGKVMHMLKATDPAFRKFGEIYFSCAWPGAVKAWHVHRTMTLNLVVVSGRAKFACCDMRVDSETHQAVERFYLSESADYGLLTIPPNVASGYAAWGDKLVIVANCATEPHDPNEIQYMPWDKLPGTELDFRWLKPHG